MAMAERVARKKPKKGKRPREITEEYLNKQPENPDSDNILVQHQNSEIGSLNTRLLNETDYSVRGEVVAAKDNTEKSQNIPHSVSPANEKLKNFNSGNTSSVNTSVISATKSIGKSKDGEEHLKKVSTIGLPILEKPVLGTEIVSNASNIVLSAHHQSDKFTNSRECSNKEADSGFSIHKQVEVLESSSEYTDLSTSELPLNDTLEKSCERILHRKDELKSKNVWVNQENLESVAPSAPLATKCTNRIRSLDESSLCSLYPLRSHKFHLPSEAIVRNHPLFALLNDYLCSCNHLECSLQKHELLISKAEGHRNSVWTLTEEQVVELGKCKDQVTVAATYCRTSAVKDEMHLSQLGNCLSASRENLHAECAFYLFDSETHHLRIEFFVQAEEEAQAACPSRDELCTCIAILFSFVQQQDLNSNFISKVHGWLLRLGKALHRVALPSDRLLLLSQILHCPKGVSSWATPLIQFEPPPQISTLDSAVSCRPELEVVVEAISTIVNSPALRQVEKASRKSMTEDVWVVLDSAGEEELLDVPGDADLDKILDCIPLKAAVVHALGLVGEECPTSLTAVDLLKRFSLSNSMIKILGNGLLKSGLQRFPCFSKKLSMCMQHLIHFTSDFWELSTSLNCLERDPAMQARVAVEFDALFTKAMGYLFQCGIRLCGWEVLPKLPYRLLSLDARWNILCLLHNFEKEKWFDDLVIPSQDIEDWVRESKGSAGSFRKMIMCTSDQEASLLLVTLRNLAFSCEDSTFAEAVAYDIFMIGHLDPLAAEKEFSKAANDHMASIFSKHPSLFSTLLKWLRDVSPEVEKGIIKLFSSLPLHLWVPSEIDLKTLSCWILQNDPQSVKNSVSRNILLGISWRENSVGEPLPADACYGAAALALEACLAWDSKGRMSQLATSVMWPKSTISTWAWSLVGALPIHPYDRRNEPSVHANSPSKSAFLEVLNRGLKENHPLANLLAVLATDIGHDWTNAQKNAFSHLSIVVGHGKYTAAISSLYLILPLFVNNVDDLINCKSFEKLLLSLLFADYTYVQMATNLIVSNFPGPVLTELGNMMVSHLEQSHRFGTTCSSFVCLWLNCIFLVPNWMHKKEMLYLADLAIRSALLDESGKAWNEAICLLKKQKEQFAPTSKAAPSGTLSSLFNLLSMAPSPGSPHPCSLVVHSSWPEFPWFVLAALDVDEEYEMALWDYIQMDLGARPCNFSLNSISLNDALKNACQRTDIQPFPATCLTIFRWARQALDTPVSHSVLPLLWARFFSVYNKVYSSHSNGIPALFEGHSSWKNFLASMKKRLNESYKWYYSEAAAIGDDDPELMLWLKHCARLFSAFGLWLEDNQHCNPPSNLPVQYAPERLEGALLHAKRRVWRKDYIHTVGVRRNIESAVESWEALRGVCDKIPINQDLLQYSLYSHPLHRITERLNSLSDSSSTPFPPDTASPMRFKDVQPLHAKEVSSKAIRSCILPLVECARLYSLYNSEHVALDCSLLELLPLLYQDTSIEVTRFVCCKQSSSQKNIDSSKCSSPAKITFKETESQVCEKIRAQLDRNLTDRARLINSVLHLAPQEACAASVSLENIVKELVLVKKSISQRSKVCGTAIILLDSLLDMFSEDTVFQYLPTKKLLNSCVETLGQEFIAGEESQLLPLLSKMIERPQLVAVLAPLLLPSNMSTSIFLQAYDILIRHLPNMDANVAFVLLSKFDIGHWLSQDNPLDVDRVHLVHFIINGLSSCGMTKDSEPTIIAGLLQSHMRILLIHSLPELFLEVIKFLLKASGDHCLQTFVWYDVLDTVISLGISRLNTKPHLPLLNADISPEQLSSLLKEFATEQRILTLEQVKNVANFLGDYFHNERLHFGLHGLYPKYRSHIKAIQVLFELLGHLLIAASNGREIGMFTSSGSAGYLWPSLSNMFDPWLVPYWEDQLKEEGAYWILELMDGHPPLTPWIPSDSVYARTIALSFSRCICFLMDIFPGYCNTLTPVWEMYTSSIARAGVGCHILEIIHEAFSTILWNQFWPSLQNLKDMVDVMERAPSECHVFIFHIATQIRWKEWIGSIALSESLCAQALASLLKLILLLTSNNSVKKVDCSGLHSLLREVQSLPWHHLSTSDFAKSLDLFIKHTKPEVVLGWKMLSKNEDFSLLSLLQSIASVYDPQQQEGLPSRCLQFFGAITKLLFMLLEGVKQDKMALNSTKCVFPELLKEFEAAVVKGFPSRGQERQTLEMAEVIKFVLLPHFSSAEFSDAVSEALSPKQSAHDQSNTLFAKGLLHALHYSNLPNAQLHLLVESALEASLVDEQDVFSLLDDIPKLLHFQGDSKVQVADALSSCGHLLALSACLRKSSSLFYASNSRESSNSPLQLLVNRWLPAVCFTENMEAKMPLLWAHALLLAQDNHGGDGSTAEALDVLATTLFTMGNSQDGVISGLLGAIGLKKSLSPSIRFKILSIGVAAFSYAYLGEKEIHSSRLKDALKSGEKICKRYKEFNDIATLLNTTAMKPDITLKDGMQLIEKLLNRLYPERCYYIQCIY